MCFDQIHSNILSSSTICYFFSPLSCAAYFFKYHCSASVCIGVGAWVPPQSPHSWQYWLSHSSHQLLIASHKERGHHEPLSIALRGQLPWFCPGRPQVIPDIVASDVQLHCCILQQILCYCRQLLHWLWHCLCPFFYSVSKFCEEVKYRCPIYRWTLLILSFTA